MEAAITKKIVLSGRRWVPHGFAARHRGLTTLFVRAQLVKKKSKPPSYATYALTDSLYLVFYGHQQTLLQKHTCSLIFTVCAITRFKAIVWIYTANELSDDRFTLRDGYPSETTYRSQAGKVSRYKSGAGLNHFVGPSSFLTDSSVSRS